MSVRHNRKNDARCLKRPPHAAPRASEGEQLPCKIGLRVGYLLKIRMRNVFAHGRHLLGIDRAVFFTVMARTWSSAAGLVTVALISKFLTPEAQGYYYTFVSLVALQIVFELGFSFVILQLASHECAHLNIQEDGFISGNPVAHERLASVLQKAVRWYSTAAVLLVAVLIPAGLLFFARHSRPGANVSYVVPWCLVVLAAGMTFQLDPILSFMEGCGYVARVANLRLLQAVAGSFLAWTALLSGHGLFAPCCMILGQALVGFSWIFRKRGLLLGLLRYSCSDHRVQWMKEVWQFQWRMAISWISGYFIFQLFTPTLFAYRGPTAAGQMGMSLSVSGALTAICISWVNTKAAPFGTMIAQKRWGELDQVFFRALTQSLVICAVGALAIWLGILYLNQTGSSFARRMLDPKSLGVLLLTALINQVWFSEAVYIRAHKQEKYLSVSLATAILVTFSTLVFGNTYGAWGMVVGYLAVSIVVGFGFGLKVFLKYRALWHAQ